jgi:GABA(A) receptor-associated protein
MKFQFKEEKSFEDRQAEANKVLDLYPNRIPVIVEKWPQSHLPNLTNKKFLVEKDSSAAQLLVCLFLNNFNIKFFNFLFLK